MPPSKYSISFLFYIGARGFNAGVLRLPRDSVWKNVNGCAHLKREKREKNLGWSRSRYLGQITPDHGPVDTETRTPVDEVSRSTHAPHNILAAVPISSLPSRQFGLAVHFRLTEMIWMSMKVGIPWKLDQLGAVLHWSKYLQYYLLDRWHLRQ